VLQAIDLHATGIVQIKRGLIKRIKRNQKGTDLFYRKNLKIDQSPFAWIESALSKQTGDILYRDIQAALADAFSSIPSQTPYFVNQGSGLETFSAVTEEMRELSAARIIDLSPLNNEKNIEEILKYEISKNESNHVDHADAIAAVETSFDLLASKKISDTLVSKFYKKTILTSLKLVDLPQTKLFSAFGENQGWEKNILLIYSMRRTQLK